MTGRARARARGRARGQETVQHVGAAAVSALPVGTVERSVKTEAWCC